jgi:hypothetical protein
LTMALQSISPPSLQTPGTTITVSSLLLNSTLAARRTSQPPVEVVLAPQ